SSASCSSRGPPCSTPWSSGSGARSSPPTGPSTGRRSRTGSSATRRRSPTSTPSSTPRWGRRSPGGSRSWRPPTPSWSWTCRCSSSRRTRTRSPGCSSSTSTPRWRCAGWSSTGACARPTSVPAWPDRPAARSAWPGPTTSSTTAARSTTSPARSTRPGPGSRGSGPGSPPGDEVAPPASGGRRSASDRTGLASPRVAETRTRWRTVDPLRPGDPREVAGFHVVGRLGAGGMGVVYLADHPEHGPAALKFVRAGGPAVADPAFRARFGREVEAARRVRSPRVARVLAADPDATGPWLATAFVDGPTLQEAVEAEGPMSGDRLVALAVALADALAAVHEAGVVHRDLKPRNILLTPETPVLIDFGIASVREAPQLTRAGAALGTPGWMAPEQARGQRCGPATDVFAWGAVLAF